MNYASRSDQRKGKMKRLNPLAQMMEEEIEESDSEDEQVRQARENRLNLHCHHPSVWKDREGSLALHCPGRPQLPQVWI